MSTAKLNVWITRVGEPCRIADRELFVYVLHCNGEVLEWCGRRYVAMETKCGQLETEIPVGCYVVGAVEKPVDDPRTLGNHLTHIVPIRANCGDHICVTLFNPTLSHCGHWFGRALRDAVEARALPREAGPVLRQAIEAVDRVLEVIPRDEFTLTQAKALEEQPRGRRK